MVVRGSRPDSFGMIGRQHRELKRLLDLLEANRSGLQLLLNSSLVAKSSSELLPLIFLHCPCVIEQCLDRHA